MPRILSVGLKTVETKLACGNSLDLRNLSPASSSAKPFTLLVIDAVSTDASIFDFSIAAGSFVVPWVPLVLIAIVPTAFALLAAGQPARAVGRIRPAVALRIAD